MMSIINMKPAVAVEPPDPLVLLQELNHRVANDYMTLISDLAIAARGLTNSDDRAALINAQNRIRALADAHRALQAPCSETTVELSAYLMAICDATAKARATERRLTLFLPNAEVVMTSARAWRVGLIVVELLTNAAKHGKRTGEIVVELQTVGRNLICSVANEGCFAQDAHCGSGLAIIGMLAEDIGGRLEYRAGNGWIGAALVAPVDDKFEAGLAPLS